MANDNKVNAELPIEPMAVDNSAKQDTGSVGECVPQTIVKHKRGVSWDASSFSARPVSAAASGRLKEIQGATPMESEADTYLLQTLEEVDPISQDEVPSVLGSVTKEEESIFQAPKPITPKEASASPFHRRKDTAENLWTLTHKLKSAHNVAHTESLTNKFDQEVPDSQAGSLAANAAALLQRKRRESMKAQSEDAGSLPQKINPAANWAKLRTAVGVASAAGTKKKTDEQQEEVQASPEDLEAGESGKDSSSGSYGKSSHAAAALTRKNKLVRAKDQIASDFHEFKTWLSFKRIGAFQYLRFMVLWIMIPSAAIAAILFYLGDNPPCGTQSECLRAKESLPPTSAPVVDVNATEPPDEGADIEDIFGGGKFFGAETRYDSASVSWWFLFVGVRQVVTFMLARMTEVIVIDFLCLRTQWTARVLGPFIALFIVQSKGWPIRFIFWGVYDFALLYGDYQFPRHWCYWQDVIDLFNRANPAGNVTHSNNYRIILILMIVCGGAVAAKRFFMGLQLGKKTYSRYAQDLEKVMKKTLLLSEVAYLAKRIEKDNFTMTDDMGIQSDLLQLDEAGSKDGSVADQSLRTQRSATTLMLHSLGGSNRIRIDQMLGAWEEPQETRADEEAADISSIIQFRQALSFLNTTHPFSIAFGLADTRAACVASSERVFNRLMISNPGREALNFDTLALITVNKDGSLDESKLKELVKLVRPDREGNLTLIDFCKSVDTVYKELRLLRASVANGARVDQAFERIVNIVFYFILGCIVLAVLGIDPFSLFVAVSGFLVGFAFMIGAACSKYFEGLLMVLVRKPYDIGDRININGPEEESSAYGAPGWIVKDITLYHTTILYWTQEVATVSNGSIANSRIINASRSPQAVLNFLQKFPIDVPLKKVQIFQTAMEKFIKARPREWLSFLAFRPTRVEADGAFVEYIVLAQHRENWANMGALLTSKAELQSFCLELSKKMGMRYVPPALPVDLNANFNPASMESLNAIEHPGTSSANEEFDEQAYSKDVDEIAAMFASAK